MAVSLWPFQFHPENIIPSGDWIFVFGGNLAGGHSKGAAKIARLNFRAVNGVGRGPTGMAYAIPTKDERRQRLPLPQIAEAIGDFLCYARSHTELNFFVTRVGCDVACYSDDEIGPKFALASPNCSLPDHWQRYVARQRAAARTINGHRP